MMTRLNNVGMDGSAVRDQSKVGTGLEDKRKREIVRRNTVSEHMGEYQQGILWTWTVSESLDEDVGEEGVGSGDLEEESESIVQRLERIADSKELGGNRCITLEIGGDNSGLDLSKTSS